jgi:hypothetical protein
MFFAYPGHPEKIGTTIEAAVNKINLIRNRVKTWRALSIAGSFIINNIQDAIKEEDIFIADISKLNFNVTYEIGYAIAKEKPILLVKNASLVESDISIREVGIFDTIGYEEYSNSDELFQILSSAQKNILIGDTSTVNKRAPVYILEQKFKTDFAIRITTRIKKARYIYRSFDPNESPRLSAYDAINQVQQSFGVLVSLIPSDEQGSFINNIRAAFIAGLAHGKDIATCILQHGSDPVPIDYRDFANIYYTAAEIDNYIADFAGRIAEAFQGDIEIKNTKAPTFLQQIDIGASAAENEMRFLQSYYLKTDAYLKTLRGDVQLVVGRKGSGKTAIFLQIRDKERSKGGNVVLDLKPEGYKLIKFKELVLSYLQAGTFHHTISAFWEYIILLEICHRILENDKVRHVNNNSIFDLYKNLEEVYKAEGYLTEGDFSERMSRLINNVTESYSQKYGKDTQTRLSAPQVTDLIYKSDIRILRSSLINYLKKKDKVWLLLDNIDKGWPSSGLQAEDIIIIRTLIDALRNVQRQFGREDIDMFPVVFLRNDVYELLMDGTADRQKEAKEVLDWTDPDMLREVIRLRISTSGDLENEKFEDIWRTVCVSHFKGEETSQYLIDRSLMRPRFLINFINQCRSFAVNFNHKKIEPEDIEKGFESYSSDLLIDINYEIRDVFPEAENILYSFIEAPCDLSLPILNEILEKELPDSQMTDRVIDLLLWYGFLGIKTGKYDVKYIYNFNYNMNLLKGVAYKNRQNVIYVINPAFWPSLLIGN